MKVQHLYSTTAGDVPASLLRGQLAVNIPDKTVWAATPDGTVKQISNGNPGVANASSMLNVHIPTQLHPVAQLGVGYTQPQLQAKFNVGSSTVSLQTVPVFALGQVWYTPPLSCALSSVGAYLLFVNTVARTAALSPLTGIPSTSGTFNAINGNFNIVIYSDSIIYPWFYVPAFKGIANGSPGSANGDCSLYRISPTKTFGAIPVSAGFPGTAATSYWGAP